MWVLFTAPCPTPDGRTARDLYEKRLTWIDDVMRASALEHGCAAGEFFELWQIEAEPGEIGTAIELDGDVGLVPLGGDAA